MMLLLLLLLFGVCLFGSVGHQGRAHTTTSSSSISSSMIRGGWNRNIAKALIQGIRNGIRIRIIRADKRKRAQNSSRVVMIRAARCSGVASQ